MADWLKRVLEEAERLYEILPDWKKKAIEGEGEQQWEHSRTSSARTKHSTR